RIALRDPTAGIGEIEGKTTSVLRIGQPEDESKFGERRDGLRGGALGQPKPGREATWIPGRLVRKAEETQRLPLHRGQAARLPSRPDRLADLSDEIRDSDRIGWWFIRKGGERHKISLIFKLISINLNMTEII
ncbi:MAG: hypothetical protein WD715_11270, partial [Dongiaceae bacterium]